MPLYSYKCELCKEEFELLEKLSSVLEPKICKKCGILEQHKLWLDSEGEDGTRACLSNTDLSEIDLSGVNLRRANLSMANLSGIDLSHANLSLALS